MKFSIPLSPKAQKRDRITTIGGRGASFKDKGQRQEEYKIMALAYAHRPAEPLTGALVFGIRAYRPIPKSKPKKWQQEARAGTIRPTGRPDLSNLCKQLEDVFNRVFWTDDSLIVEYLPGTGKYYDDGGGPRWDVEILTLKEYQDTIEDIVWKSEVRKQLPPVARLL
jgi:Holliday junction resolvase RusA-like endonuclease